METRVKCPYCGEEIAESAIKCKHCNEWLEKADSEAPQNTEIDDAPIDTNEENGHVWAGIACVVAMFLEIISFFQYIGGTLNMDNASKYGKLSRFVNFSNLIPEWIVISGSITLYIYILLVLRKHFIAKKSTFTQYLFLSIISLCIVLANTVFENDDFNLSTTVLRLGVIMMIYEIVIGVKILRNYINSILLGVSFIIYAVVSFFVTAVLFTDQTLTLEDESVFIAISTGITILWLYVIKYYLKSAPALAEPSNIKTTQATQNESHSLTQRGMGSWIVFGLVILGLSLSSLFINNNDDSSSDTPSVIEEFRPWVAENYLSLEMKNNIYSVFIAQKFNAENPAKISHIGDYSDDESGDASWGETKIYYALAEVVLNNIKIYSREKLFLRDDIKEKVGQFVKDGAGGWGDLYQKLENQYGYDPFAIEYYLKMLSRDKDRVFRNVVAVIEDLSPVVNKLSSAVELVEWDVDSEFETYTIYSAIYKVEGIYVLCSVLERENGNAEIQVVEKSKMLLDLHE